MGHKPLMVIDTLQFLKKQESSYVLWRLSKICQKEVVKIKVFKIEVTKKCCQKKLPRTLSWENYPKNCLQNCSVNCLEDCPENCPKNCQPSHFNDFKM